MLQPLSYDTGNDEIIMASISYLISYSGANITDGTITTTNSSINIILPAVNSDVNVNVTAMNVFGMGPASEFVVDDISKFTGCIICTLHVHIVLCTNWPWACVAYVRTYICIIVCMFVCVLVSSSIINVVAVLETPNENRTLHSIIVTCTSDLDSMPDQCVVMVTPVGGGDTLMGNYITIINVNSTTMNYVYVISTSCMHTSYL